MTPTLELSLKLGRYELTDEQYNRIRPLLSGKPGDPGRNADDNRRFLNAVLWIARTGAPRADLPERFGKYDKVKYDTAKYDTVYQRSGRCAKKGRWQGIFEALQEPDLDWVMLDSTAHRAQQHAAGRKKVERFFNRVKHYRRIATRYEKTAHNYMAMLHLASAIVWLL